MQALVKHSQTKDKFWEVAVKRMTKTQLFEDDLKELSQLMSYPISKNQK
jgi:hypothetical protein